MGNRETRFEYVGARGHCIEPDLLMNYFDKGDSHLMKTAEVLRIVILGLAFIPT